MGYSKTEKGRESVTADQWHTASVVGSENGPVNLYAGKDVTISGSQVVAGTGDVAISGREVTIENQYDTYDAKQKQWFKQSGVTLSVGLGGAAGQVVDKGVEASRMLGNAQNAHTDNAAILYGITGVRNAYEVVDGVKGLLSGGLAGGGGLSIGVGLGFSKSESKSQSQTHDQVAVGSSITSGGDTIIVARGEEGNDHSGDLNIIGSHVNAGGTVTLAANNNLNLLSAEELSTYQHSNKSSGSGFGIGYEFGTGGAGLSVNGYANQSKGKGSGTSVTHAETVVSGTEGVTFISGNDTTLKGAQIFGGQVTGQVSGDLTIISEQETNTDRLNQKSSGGGFSTGGGLADTSLSYNQQKQNAKGDYASVNEQSGIWAGQGGFDIEVGGHTGLTGAVIASEAEAEKNSLTTATLSTEDIQNKSSYSAETKGWGVEISGDKGSISPSLPMEEDGKDHSTTKSAIAPGTVTITDEAAQQARTGQSAAETIANLNRDTDNAHQGPLAHNPDLQDLLDKQAELQDAAAQAGQAVAKTVGDVSQRLYAETGDEKWADGGIYKTLLHAAGAALVAQLGNGEGLNAALGTAASQLAAGQIKEFAQNLAGQMTTDPEARELLANLLTNIAAGGIGQAAGGETGAAVAAIIDRYNRQMHDLEKQFIAKLLEENQNLDKDRLEAAACALILCYAEFPEGSNDYELNKAKAELGASAACKNERDALLRLQQQGSSDWRDYRPTVFAYDGHDAAEDLIKRYKIENRMAGTVTYLAAGYTELALIASQAVPETAGVGLVLRAAAGAYYHDQMMAGWNMMITGNETNTYFNAFLINDLGLTPTQAMAVNGFIDIYGARTVAKQLIAAQSSGKFNYTSFEQSVKQVTTGVDPKVLIPSHSISGKTSSKTVVEYIDDIKSGVKLKPIEVVEYQGQYYVADGHHRLVAAKATGTKVDIKILTEAELADGHTSYKTILDVVNSSVTAGPNRLRLK